MSVSCVHLVQHFINLISSISVLFLGVPLHAVSQGKRPLVYFGLHRVGNGQIVGLDITVNCCVYTTTMITAVQKP